MTKKKAKEASNPLSWRQKMVMRSKLFWDMGLKNFGKFRFSKIVQTHFIRNAWRSKVFFPPRRREGHEGKIWCR